jgi:hypothetical protein
MVCHLWGVKSLEVRSTRAKFHYAGRFTTSVCGDALYRCLQVSENSGLGNTSKIDLTVIWRGTIVNMFKLVHAL